LIMHHHNGYYKYYGTMNLQWYEAWGERIILYIVNICSYSKIFFKAMDIMVMFKEINITYVIQLYTWYWIG